MTITGDYAHPVTVNGYSCKNCTDVDYAKKHIDPAHPKDGPYGLDARSDDKRPGAIRLGGLLAGLNADPSGAQLPVASGAVIDFRI